MVCWAGRRDSFRLKIELLPEGTPLRLLLPDEFLRRFRSIDARDRKSQCKEPLLAVRLLQEPTDLLIQPRYDVRRPARGRDHDQPAVDLEARQRFANRGQVIGARETLRGADGYSPHLAGIGGANDCGE